MEQKERGELTRQRTNLRGLLQVRNLGGRWLQQTETHRIERERSYVRRRASRIVLWEWKRFPVVSFEGVVFVSVLLSVIVITLQEAGPDWNTDVDHALT